MKRIGFLIAALMLAVGMAVGMSVAPTVAMAEDSATLKARLDEARATRDSLYEQAGQASEALNETLHQLDVTQEGIDETNAAIQETKVDIQAKEAELAERRGEVADQVVQDYKSGGFRLLDLILSSKNIEEFVSHVYYADKVSEQQAQNIHETQELQAALEAQQQELVQEEQSLEAQKAEQQSLASQQEQQKADLDAKAQEAAAYVDGLDQDLKEALAAEEAAARAAAEAAARQAQQALQQQQQQAPAPSAPSSSGSSSGSSAGSSSGSSGSSGSGSSQPSVSVGGGGGLTSAQRSAIINAALSMVGGNYVYGAYDPGSATFDCSGFTKYCYAQAGIYLPHSSASQAGMCDIRSIGSLQPGDLVFWSGHVAIYYGDGMIIEASTPGTGIVGPHSIWGSPYGGGTPV